MGVLFVKLGYSVLSGGILCHLGYYLSNVGIVCQMGIQSVKWGYNVFFVDTICQIEVSGKPEYGHRFDFANLG